MAKTVGPTTREAVIQALIEGLTMAHACEVSLGTAYVEQRRAYSFGSRCVLCEQKAAPRERIEHGPYCPVTLAHRLRDESL